MTTRELADLIESWVVDHENLPALRAGLSFYLALRLLDSGLLK